MTATDFVDRLREVVLAASVSDAIKMVVQPPGRRPAPDLVDVSRWFNALESSDQRMVERMLKMVAHQSVFGLLSVLDSTRQIESTAGPKGHFELRYIKDGQDAILSGPDGEVLHELL